MTDHQTPFDDVSGLERMNWNKFAVTYTVRRPSQAPNKFDAWDTMQLPNNSVLHTLNGFDTLASGQYLPDPNLKLVVNEKAPVFLKIHRDVALPTSQPFGVKENFVYRPNVVAPLIQHYRQEHRQFRWVLSDKTLGQMPGVLGWVDYSPLNSIKVMGVLHDYRKFDVIFRTMLDKIVSIGAGAHHFIYLPQSQHVFARPMLQRTFRELSPSTLNILSHDPSVFPLLHVLGYVSGRTKDVSVVPYKEDVKILGKDDPMFASVHSTSLFERLPDSLLSSINFIFHRDNKAVVYNLADLKNFADDPSFITKLYRHLMNLRLSEQQIPDQMDRDSDQFDSYVQTVADKAEIDPTSNGIPLSTLAEKAKEATSAPSVSSVITVTNNKTETPVAAPKSFEERIRKKVDEHHAPLLVVEPKKASKKESLTDNHFKVLLNGKPLGESIQEPGLETIAPKSMDFINSTPEASYQKSSLAAMDKAYQQHHYHHEMAKVVGSLAKHGMFITKTEEDLVHTEMDRTVTYKLHLSDVNGKTHHIKYTLPHIDDNGMMKLSGVEYRLTRQIVNVPICKTTATRVNLASYYNKVIVERIQSKRFSYEQVMLKFLTSLKNAGLIEATMGQSPLPTSKVAYDYSAIGRNFTDIKVGNYHLVFGGDRAPMDGLTNGNKASIQEMEKTLGSFVGYGPEGSYLFWNLDGEIVNWKLKGDVLQHWTSVQAFFAERLGPDGRVGETPVEWTQANIINQVVPLVFILAYRFGLKRVLEMIRLDYRFYPDKRDLVLGVDDVAVTFADGTLVFNRYPVQRSLIANGLRWADLRGVTFGAMDVPDTYTPIFNQKKMTVGVLKGLNGFFDFFVDPITEKVLEKMGEPITFHELLLRANLMLSDYASIASTSVELHRFRRYERFNGMVYNEVMRSLQNYRNAGNSKKSFSINPEAVFQQIVQDATVGINEVINPVHEVKQQANFTFTGKGGRSGDSFVLKDRIFPKDGLGVISDAVPDSSKVSITSYLSASPRIDDIHGIPKPYKDGDVLEPPQILSIGSMVMPGGTTDDGKRNSYLSIQISHYVPNHEDGETLSVRTGYDEVLPHLSSSVFATAAERDGVVESLDRTQKVLRIRYVDTPATTLRKLKLPYLDVSLDTHLRDKTSFGFLIKDTDIGDYPIGGVFELTKRVYGKITDRLRCDTVASIPDKDVVRRQGPLLQDLEKGRVQALYYIRFQPQSNMVPGEVKSFSFADSYSLNSGSYLLQKLEPNVAQGERFKTGDILIFNPGFFVPDPLSKQVTFKHGVTANVALIDKSTNHEDSCEISRDFGKRMKMTPGHLRTVITKNTAALLGVVKVGQHVESSDSLCVISDEFLVGSSTELHSDNLDIFEKLNRQTPSAGYTGTIQKIRVLYSCDRDSLSESVKTILKVYEKEERDRFKALNHEPSAKPPERPGWVKAGTRYAGLEFSEGTVVLEFMIDEELGMEAGDKAVAGLSSKSVVSHVNEKTHYTESGIPIDMLFSTHGVLGRIVNSPFMIGLAERIMLGMKDKVTDIYFDKK